MTVATEASYAERIYTGIQSVLFPDFTALDASYVHVGYLDPDNGLPVEFTSGIHFTVSLDENSFVSVARIAFPPASADRPLTIWIERITPAVQGVNFSNLARYDASVHEVVADAGAMRDAELRNRQARAITPFFANEEIADFRPRRVKASDPVDGEDLATKAWVLASTGIDDLLQLVQQAAASAAAAAASVLEVAGFAAAAATARDRAQAWSDTPENSNVPGTAEFSAFHWSRKAAAAAAMILPYLVETDDGFFGDPETGSRIDDGAFG